MTPADRLRRVAAELLMLADEIERATPGRSRYKWADMEPLMVGSGTRLKDGTIIGAPGVVYRKNAGAGE